MQEQLTELQLKLAKEEEQKGNVSKLNQDLAKVIQPHCLLWASRVAFCLIYFYPLFTSPRNNP